MNQIPNIEEIVEKMLAIGWDSKLKKHDGTSIVVSFTKAELCDLLLSIEENHHQQLQKARTDWLREEIVRLEGEKLPKTNEHGSRSFFVGAGAQMRMETYNQALQTIIDRYHSELDQDKVLITLTEKEKEGLFNLGKQ